MKDSIHRKLETLLTRYEEVAMLLGDSEVISNQDKFTRLSKEYAKLEPLVNCYKEYQQVMLSLESAEALLADDDPELRELAAEERDEAKANQERLQTELQLLLLPQDPDDERNVFLEIRAGTGGNEAALFAGDLFRMYAKFAESMGWQLEIMSTSDGEQGGYKEIIARISGQDVYSRLKFESGAHRVQRVPETESQGRIHTSACTVAIMPEAAAIDEIVVNPADLKIDTFRASGAGGQHVNKTDSAIRITHLPTGTVVECQDERSQHKNRARALSILQAKLMAAEKNKAAAEQAATRRDLVGSGDRSERIRTYNFPQGRLTDHRIGLTLYKLDDIMAGNLSLVVQPLIQEHQADLLTSLADEYE